jgi:putative ABC transport system permease protein
LKNKVFSCINITGLAIGMACSILILLWVQEELSYEQFHDHIDDLYRVYWRMSYSGGQELITDNTAGPLAAEMKDEFPEVKDATRFLDAGSRTVRSGTQCFNEYGFCFVDPSFLGMFTFPLKTGNTKNALSEPFSILLTTEMSEKYFGDENPLGKVLTIDNRYDFKVTGIFEKIPKTTHLSFNFLVPFAQTKELVGDAFDRYNRNWPRTYVRLEHGANIESFVEKLTAYVHRHIDDTYTYALQPVRQINLYTMTGQSGYIVYMYLFTIIAFCILLIACINFMNLSTTRSSTRAKEIGLRKVQGAHRSHLISQFFGESILLSFIALAFALILVKYGIPVLYSLSGADVSLDFMHNRFLVVMTLGIALITGSVSGIYPAVYLSSYQPITAIKGVLKKGTKGSRFRRILVIFQFTTSIILIIVMMVIHEQTGFMIHGDLGYDTDHLLYLVMRGDAYTRYEALQNELLKNPDIIHVTATSRLPISGGDSSSDYIWEGKDPEQRVLINRIHVDNDYFETMNIQMAAGRAFQQGKTLSPKDAPIDFIVNEEAVRQMGLDSPVGAQFGMSEYEGTIVGVAKDFHFSTLDEKIEPVVLVVNPERTRFLIARLNPENISETLPYIESTWQKTNSHIPLSFGFFDELLGRVYQSQRNLGLLFRYFSILALCIAGLGLFGLSSFSVTQRTKEIGIRKVLGASVSGIAFLLSKDLTRVVILANGVAWPIGYVITNRWLQNFAYRIEIHIWIFLLAGITVLSVALLTVSTQSIKAALADPVECLRYE